MSAPKRIITGIVLAASLAGAAIGWVAQRAWADGIPTAPATLYYSGYVEDDTGPLTGSTGLRVSLWGAATGGAAPLCTSGAITSAVDQGHFRIPLPATCVDVLHANPDVWVEVEVGGETLPRQHLGAVPYAVEAERASSAARADRIVYTNPTTGEAVSAGGGLCGTTAPTSSRAVSGALTGYRAVRALCQTACGSPTAHLCSGDEVLASHVTGTAVPGGWVTTGAAASLVYGSAGGTITNLWIQRECRGYTYDGSDEVGARWDATASMLAWEVCRPTDVPFLCCD